jgi:hypothetical protein
MIILILLELANVFFHTLVLLNIKTVIDFKNISNFSKKYYFILELVTSLLSFVYVYNISNYAHIIMIIIHFLYIY